MVPRAQGKGNAAKSESLAQFDQKEVDAFLQAVAFGGQPVGGIMVALIATFAVAMRGEGREQAKWCFGMLPIIQKA